MSVETVDDYCKVLRRNIHLTNATVTTLSRAKYLWKSPRGTVVRIEILVVLAAFFFVFLGTFGRYRRRSRTFFIQKGIFAAFTLSSSLVAYILGSMQSSSVKSSMYTIWATSLFLLHGCTDSITAHTLSDNTQLNKQLYQTMLYNVYGGFLFMSDPNVTRYLTWKSGLVYYLFLLSLFKFIQRVAACTLAASSWNLNKMVADYMYEEHKGGGSDAEAGVIPSDAEAGVIPSDAEAGVIPEVMKDCHYLVDWPLAKSKMDTNTYRTKITADSSEIISMDRIWSCSSLGKDLKYECLSFSLFHLLRRRVFGFTCGESKARAHDFVFKGLLSKGIPVFKVIETELAFMYDFYFTKYAVLYYRSRAATIWFLVSVSSICFAVYGVATRRWKFSCARTRDLSYILNTEADVTITLVILASAGLLEFIQMLVFRTGVWGRVSFACQLVREEGRVRCSNIMSLKGLLARIGARYESKKNYWVHELGQYSLIEAVNYKREDPRTFLKVRKFIKAMCLRDYALLGSLSAKASGVRGKKFSPVKLRPEIQKAVVDSLMITEGKLTNGTTSLEKNGAGCLSQWNVQPGTTCVILTWHIATCYCEMMMIATHGGVKNEPSVDFGVATELSRYCAHLVVSQPKLLPGHHYDTVSVFNAVAEEAVDCLQGQTDSYEAMKNVMVQGSTVFTKGVELGKKLEEEMPDKRWKVLADFWAEMLLYAAPSDNVTEHIDKLANGGEFITHIWALLSHAGILAREDKHQGGSA